MSRLEWKLEMEIGTGDVPVMKQPYGAALSGNWQTMSDYYKYESFRAVHPPITFSDDTPLHISVCSKKEQPLKDLLEILKDYGELGFSEEEVLLKPNKYGNTVLHEATIAENLEAVKILVERCPELVSVRNKFGETPLFTAAGFAGKVMVQYLILKLPELIMHQNGRQLQRVHRRRDPKEIDGASILHAAIQGGHFETALLLLNVDESLQDIRTSGSGISALDLLATMPSSFKSSSGPMDITKSLFYCCLPVDCINVEQEETREYGRQQHDLESGQGRSRRGLLDYFPRASQMATTLSSCILFTLARLVMGTSLWQKKRNHVYALRLARRLIRKERDVTRNKARKETKEQISFTPLVDSASITGKENQNSDTGETTEETGGEEEESALFKAARNGIEEIVFEILAEHPQAVWQFNNKGQSILDVAVIHRQKKIFNFVKQLKTPLHRLKRAIDTQRNTMLHHVANIDHYSGGTKPGPALQLQEELIWFERVQKIIPPHYVMIPNIDKKTAKELFDVKHKDQLKQAQKWMKETAQSCSTVAALVATVVFAAAYTAPGGANDRGVPNYIHSPYFLIFTVSDVVSLASSLTSLAVFLSVLTSPFELNGFRRSLPRRLKIGLTLLFFSVITTMLAFGSTILILIQSDRKLTTFLISVAAFLPVLVFAVMQYHMYAALLGSTRKMIPKKIRNAFSVGWEKKLKRKFSHHINRVA